jgi:penicillin-binding protein 2
MLQKKKRNGGLIRAVILIALTLATMSLGVLRLMKIQVVDGTAYFDEAESASEINQVISSPRGEITDVNGTLIVGNKLGYNVIIEKAFFPSDQTEMNRIIIETIRILEKNNAEWNDTLPITKTMPYEFLPESDSEIARMRENIKVQVYASAADSIDAMVSLYDVADSYTDTEKRQICGVRHEMVLRSFSLENTYTFASGVPLQVVVELKEAVYRLSGTDIVAEAIRYVAVGDAAPHLIGTIGPVTAEEYEAYRDTGYSLNDSIGKNGVELALESELRGIKGVRTLEMWGSEVYSDTVTTPPVPGHTVKLTIDIDYQRKVQKVLENHILWLQNQDDIDKKGENATGGAIVVLDVSDGALLAAATYPTYDLSKYKEDYINLISDPTLPLYNRATNGLYRPGSTFKTITSTAALNEGFVDRSTHINCNGIYTYWSDYQPKCTGHHGRINIATAIEKSCNIYFYEVGRTMGINTLSDYATQYGFGLPTGLETGGSSGWFATPEQFEKLGLDWQQGVVVQAAIGQSETNVTPMHMAVQALTIAKDGKRLSPHIVDSIYTYNMEELLHVTTPEVLAEIPDKSGVTFSTIKEGMTRAANFGLYSYPNEEDYFAPYLLTGLPEPTAIKTGTPQMTSAEDTGSAFIGFYPAENPQIAFAGFIEHGEWSKLMIRQFIEAYLNENYIIKNPIIKPKEEGTNEIIGN